MNTNNDLPIIDAGGAERESGRSHKFLIVLIVLLVASAAVAINLKPSSDVEPLDPNSGRPLTEEEKEALLNGLASQSASMSEEERLMALESVETEEPVSLEEMQEAISQL